MKIGGFQKFSLSDFPGHTAAIIFTQGCNFRCSWCHNSRLITTLPNAETLIPEEEVMGFLRARSRQLDGVVLTGGEPTIQKGLTGFIRSLRDMGLMIKLDTNGSNPEVLNSLIHEGLLDYIAMDIKAPMDIYSRLTGIELPIEKITKSLGIISGSTVKHEFRTTYVKNLLSEADIRKIASIIPPGSPHRVQKYRKTENRLPESLSLAV